MKDLKQKILKTLEEAIGKEEGGKDFLYYLEKGTDYFEAPSSTIFHNNIEGGLAEHSWNVYQLLKEKVEKYKLKIPERNIAICGLLHDCAKTNFYVKGEKYKKENNAWVGYEAWEVDDKFPAGHGEKSVFIIQRFLKMTDEEILAVRWHMAAYDPGIHFNYPSGFPYHTAINNNKLLALLIVSDLEATYLMEKIHPLKKLN